MVLWWIGNAIFLVVVIPVVVVLLQRLKGATVEVGRQIDIVHGQAGGIVIAVDDVKALIPTRDAVKQVGAGLTRYVKAVDRLL
ncbi:MAG: hypothetical protein LC799_14950 [Actinobacteria bacterium]|nr:hypothetical protein [Actinomycetota bacterium]